MACQHWKDINIKGGGECTLGAYVKPSFGVCAQCPQNTEKGIWPTINQNPIKRVASFVQAQMTGKKVSLEIAQERYTICQSCQYKKLQNGHEVCGLSCRCPVKPKNAIIKTLTEVEENLPKWGCKHPQRKRGLGWQR